MYVVFVNCPFLWMKIHVHIYADNAAVYTMSYMYVYKLSVCSHKCSFCVGELQVQCNVSRIHSSSISPAIRVLGKTFASLNDTSTL